MSDHVIATDEQHISIVNFLKEWGIDKPDQALREYAENLIYFRKLGLFKFLERKGFGSAEHFIEVLKSSSDDITDASDIEIICGRTASHELQMFREELTALQLGIPFARGLSPWLERVNPDNTAFVSLLDEQNITLHRTDKSKDVLLFRDCQTLIWYQSKSHRDWPKTPLGKHLNEIQIKEKPLFFLASSSYFNTLSTEPSSAKVSEENSEARFISADQEKHSPELKTIIKLLELARERRCTDIGFMPDDRTGDCRVFFRIDKKRTEVMEPLAATMYLGICRTLMHRSGAHTSGSRMSEACGGRVSYTGRNNQSQYIRTSFIPKGGNDSEKEIVSTDLRLLDSGGGVLDLNTLGIKGKNLSTLEDLMIMQQGLVLLAGPTNSGKSTTIGAMINENIKHYGDTIHRLALEDPVERIIPGVNHFDVPKHIENGFESMWTEVVRHDPDLISVGEIRDVFSAKVSVRAATSGHLVLSTIHADECITGFTSVANRVPETDYFDLLQALRAVVSQRLLSKLCANCKKEVQVNDGQKRQLDLYVQATGRQIEAPKNVHKANGCDQCHGTGFKGMVPNNEILLFNPKVKQALRDRTHFDAETVNNEKLTHLHEGALELLNEGLIAFEDLLI